MKALWIILGIFNSTYLARALWDYIFLQTQLPSFQLQLSAVLLGLFWDWMPIMIILIFHRKNFKVRSIKLQD